jgi:hypothetical protein
MRVARSIQHSFGEDRVGFVEKYVLCDFAEVLKLNFASVGEPEVNS